ncbi:MAG: hypothetical protein ABW352_15835 [Polyangiales bacterium]
MAKPNETEPGATTETIEKPRVARKGDDDEKWDVIDEAAYESFPASDPPSYAGHAHDEPPKTNGESD